MTEAQAHQSHSALQWVKQQLWTAVVHVYVLSGVLVGVSIGLVRTAARSKFDKESLISLYRVRCAVKMS